MATTQVDVLTSPLAPEAIGVIRALDREGVATEDVPFYIESLLQRITMLFVDGAVADTGHTAWMLRQLARPIMILSDGLPKTIGGAEVSGEVGGCPLVRRALGRLACWVRLTESVVQAEFPNFRVLAAFSIFSLSGGNERGCRQALGGLAAGSAGGAAAADGLEVRIARLAQFFGMPDAELQAQYDHLYPYAQTIKRAQPDVSNVDAWRQALGRVSKAKGSAGISEDLLAVTSVLQAWVAWSCSTSGLEQNFAQVERVHGARTLISAGGLRGVMLS